MYKAIRSVLIFSLVAVFVGCEYWNKDMLGYLEYWSETVQMGKVEVSDATIQKNDAGADTIPVAATPTIAAYVINPQSYELLAEIGDSSSADKSVRVSDSAVQSKAQVVAHEPTLLKVQLGSADGSLEHTEFRVDFEAIRKDTMQSSGKVIGVTLRYNTPPVAPIPLVKTEGGYTPPPVGQVWEADRDGTLYWAYDDSITEETDPNCAKWFSINGTRHLVEVCKVKSNEQVDGLSVFQFKTNYGSISVAAVDSEGVSSPAVASGQAVPPATYVIKYDANGADGGTAPTSQSKTQYTDITLATNSGGLTRIGYRFTGWNTNKEGTGTTYPAGATYSDDAGVTLYAKWEVVDTVTFSKSGAVDHGDSVTLTPPAGATIYYRVQGKDEQQGAQGQFVTIKLYNEKYKPQSSTGVDIGIPEGGSVTITAHAKYADGTQSTETTGTYRLNQYTVSYDGNGYTGGTVPSQDTFYSGGAVTIQSGNGLTKTSYTFTAWKGNDGQSYSPNNTYSDNSNLILTAQWQAITYTVSYDLNEGTGDVPNPSTVTLGSSVTVGQGSLTRVGYIFNGWNTQKNGQGDKYTQGQQFTPKADTTLYAQWQVGAIINSADEAQAAINEALDAAQDGDEILIKLGANLTGNTVQGGAVIDVLSIDTTKDVSITIDGGGHTINANGNGRGLRVDAENATVTVKNITLTGANHNSNTDGGGIFFLDGKQLILDSGTIITGNTLTGTNSHGGGIYVGNSNATVIIKDNVTISDNEAVNGGGLCLSGSKTTVVMEGGTFSDNTARGNGGAVYISDNPSTGGTVRFTMKDGVFNGTNSAAKGGNHIAVDQGMQETTFVFHKDIGGKSTTRDGHSMIEVYTAHTATGYTSYVTDSKWEGDGGLKMGDLK